MQLSRCSECGCLFETAVPLSNAACVGCLSARYDWGDFHDDRKTTPRAITPLRVDHR